MANPAQITDFASLKNAIEDHANRTDLDDEGVSALMIQLAEAHLSREVRHPYMLRRDDAFSVASQFEDVPYELEHA